MPPEEIVTDNTGGSGLVSETPAAPAAPPPLTNPTAIHEGPSDTSDAELREALRVARAGRPPEDEGGDAPPTPVEKGEAPPPAAAPPKPAEPVDPKLAAQVEAAVKARADAAEARERELRQYRDQGTRIVSDAEAYAAQRKKQADDEYAQAMADLRRDPLAAVKKAGWDPIELVDNIAKYDTPEGKIQRALLETQSEVKQLRAEQKAREEAQERARAQAAQQQTREEVANTFLAELKTKYPGAEEHLKRPGMQDFYLQQANKRADELAAERGPGGAPLTYGEIAEWLGTTYGFGQAPTPPKGAPAQTQAGKAARGLSQTEQSERSGGDSRKFHELSTAEQDAVLLAEQRERTRRQQRAAQ
jgi:hypothetical protein